MDSKRLLAKTSNKNTNLTQSIEDDPLIDGPLIARNSLESAIEREFQKVPTTWGAVTLAVLHVLYVIVCLALASVCVLTDIHSAECTAALKELDSRTLVLLLKVVLWVLFFLFERCVQHHHSSVRRRGYLQFYRKTAKFKHLPLLIHSIGNAAVLIIIAPAPLLDSKVKNLSVYLLLVVICVELLASITCLLIYTVHVSRFNKQSPSPDVTEGEGSPGFSATSSGAHTEMGFRDGSSLEEVVEKQADMIEYLKQHNTLLSKKILTLTSRQTRD
ncbi:transmembrane protein 192 [Clarias gariepinus]|uniref:transmembrane protein 192 n=1 Tax=Clarias gariepinus TaxID=13013 RepID=UPI00234D3015|nr:transmembrane protein 192 [Clarias gariepinus]